MIYADLKVNDRVQVDLPLIRKVDDLEFYMRRKLEEKMWDISRKLKYQVRNEIYKTSGLNYKTGALQDSIQGIKEHRRGNYFYAGITFQRSERTPHLNTHVGDRGSFQIIQPKNRNYLTIPIKGGPAWGTRKPHKVAADFGYDNLNVIKLHGILYLVRFDKRKGKYSHKKIRDFVFRLSKGEAIKRRVHPEEIKERIVPRIVKEVENVWEYYLNRYIQGKEIR